MIKRGAQEVPAKGGEVKKSDTDRQEKIKFSPGIEKMRRIFETEEKIEKESKQERKSRVEDIRNTFEMLMDPQKREQEAKEYKERERKRIERQKKREQKQKRELVENREKLEGNKQRTDQVC